MTNFKNLLKTFLLALIVLGMFYVFITILYFVFTAKFMGCVEGVGGVFFFFGYSISLVGACTYLWEGDFWN